jgi:hypothetical protein
MQDGHDGEELALLLVDIFRKVVRGGVRRWERERIVALGEVDERVALGRSSEG